MADRVVSIKLQADASGLVQGFNRASDAANDLRNKTTSTSQKIVESARNQREAWTTVGTGLTAVGVAVTGIGVAAIRTGIQYNTLQQTTRAALSTLLGSAEAANAQMDKLDDFARNSPFAKQTFIQAQQQMLGFGVAAEDVIPALDAIQNAVAAMGGSNEQISAISEIMARINSESRLSGDALQRLGYYGIDAAEIIGSQMGKSAAEIRDMARKPGGIPVEQIWDPLVTGLQEKFGGAADNVKDTFAGAMDRVKAAWRDFSSELARPLVDPDGGGALVDLLNWAADAMRAFEDLSPAVKDTIRDLVGLAGVGTLVLGSTLLVLPKILDFTGALKDLGVTGANTATLLGKIAPAAIALAAIPLAARATEWMDGLYGAQVSAGEFQAELRATGSAAESMNKALSGAGNLPLLADKSQLAVDNLRSLNTVTGDLKARFENTDLGKALAFPFGGLGRQTGIAKENIEELDRGLAGLVAGGNMKDAAAGFEEVAELMREAGYEQQEITDMLPQYVAAQKEAEASTNHAAEAAREAASGYTEQKDAAQEATDVLFELIDAMNEANGVAQGAENANARYQERLAGVIEHIQNAKDGVEGYSLSLDENTVEGSKNRAMFADLAAASQESAAKTLETETATLGASEANANYRDRLIAGREALIEQITAMTGNREEAVKLADKIYAIPDEHDTKITADTSQAVEAINALNRLELIPKVLTVEERVSRVLSPFKDPNQTVGRAHGGTVGYAHGGTISAANGLTVTGVGGGVYQGTVFGAGTSKADLVNVNLSTGEEVIQQPYAGNNRELLKSINRGELHQGMMQPNVVVVPQGDSGSLNIGSMKFVSSGNMHSDIGTVTHELRKLSRGGRFGGR